MPSACIVRKSEILRTPRVMQVEGLFDVPVASESEVTLDVNLPIEDLDWNIGLIVGSSGSGKTTIARQLFGDILVSEHKWDAQKSILDGFPKDLPISEVTDLLCKVGFGSAPNWLRPFHVLSNGEQFRVTMARAIAQSNDVIAIDEFTSVIDRQTAQIASHSVQKAVRKSGKQLIAVSCHYDIIDWLQPDWIYQPAGNQFQRRSLRRKPDLKLEIYSVDKTAWRLFEQYHYLSRNLNTAAQCFGGFIDGDCIAFAAYMHFPHPKTKNIKQGHRLVVHPDYQGLGIGGRIDDWLGQHLYEQGYRYHNVVAHPAMINYYSRSPRWQFLRKGFMGISGKKSTINQSFQEKQDKFSARRMSYSFCYTPPV